MPVIRFAPTRKPTLKSAPLPNPGAHLAADSPWRDVCPDGQMRRAVGYNMIRCRQQRRWTIRKVAHWMGVAPDHVAALEYGHVAPTMAEVYCLAGLFGVPLERMVMPQPAPPVPSPAFLNVGNPPAPADAGELVFDTPDFPDLMRLVAEGWWR